MTVSEQLDELFAAMSDAEQTGDNATMQTIIARARKVDGRDAVAWHRESLSTQEKKWFTAWVYARKPIPKTLAKTFVVAALRVDDASRNRYFIEPVLETYGKDRTIALLNDALETESDIPRDAREKAMYWANHNPRESRGS